MKKKTLLLFPAVLAGMVLATAVAANPGAKMANAANDTSASNTAIGTQEAVAIDYAGGTSGTYGFQAYAGISGPAWIVGDVAGRLTDGTSSHCFGSNTQDNRSGLVVTLKVNSTVAGDYFLDLFVKINDNDTSILTMSVNGAAGQEINLKDHVSVLWNDTIPHSVPVTLAEGENTIVLTCCENYTFWFGSFRITETQSRPWDGDSKNFETKQYAAGSEAVAIPYTGEDTKVYGMMNYAGLKGDLWVSDDAGQNSLLSDGDKTRTIGATGDRGAASFTFKINASEAGEAYLGIFGETYSWVNEKAVFDFKVNDAAATSIDFYALMNEQSGGKFNPTKIPVTLVEGENTITMSNAGVDGWYGAFAVYADDGEVLPTVDQVNTSSWSNKQGDMVTGADWFGLNAFDNSADYGKTGSVDYVFDNETAGKYYLNMRIMAGNALANRLQVKVNNVVQTNGDKDYFEARVDPAIGWGGDSDNKFVITLPEGKCTVTIGNYLTTVNSNKDAEVEEGTEGAVKVSNWWCHGVSFEAVPNEELKLDTTNARIGFNLFRPFSAEGLVVKYSLDDNETILQTSEYTIDSSAYNANQAGNYRIYVTKAGSTLTAYYTVSVGVSEGHACAGDTIDFDGTSTGKLSYFKHAEMFGEGTGDCEGRLFYILGDTAEDGGKKFGSNGAGRDENRQVTLKLRFNSTVAGKFALTNYVICENRPYGKLDMKVNDGAYVTTDLFYSNCTDCPWITLIDIVEGVNVIEFKTQQQYAIWFQEFVLAPIDYNALGTSVLVRQGARSGNTLIDCEGSVQDHLIASQNAHSISFGYTVEEAGNYELTMITPIGANKVAQVSVDGGTATEVALSNNESKVVLALAAGNHIITIASNGGAAGAFSLVSVKLAEYKAPKQLNLDLEGVTTTIQQGGIFDYMELGVELEYTDGSKETLSTSQYRVEGADFDTEVPGTYTVTVVYLADETIKATFTVTVEAAQSSEPTSESTSVPTSQSSETPVVPSTGGCGGSVLGASALICALAIGGLALIKGKKEDR